MVPLLQGIATFHSYGSAGTRRLLARLAVDGQSPQAMIIACADSRVMLEEVTQAKPGDLFIVRNIGNLVPNPDEADEGDASVSSAVDYGILALKIRNVIVMGHSLCGAMMALHSGKAPTPQIKSWLEYGGESLERFREDPIFDPEVSEVDRLSQINVLTSLDHLRKYDSVRENDVKLHAWWFDVARARVLAYKPEVNRFVTLEEAYSLEEAYAI